MSKNPEIKFYLYDPEHGKIEPKNEPKYVATEKMGWVKHAFILSFYYLMLAEAQEKQLIPLNENFYSDSIQEIISLGGDTDTNACIAGGLLGAYSGIHNIDPEMLFKVISFDCDF